MTEPLALGIRPTVGEGALGELPDPLVRVELRGVAREAVEVEPGEGTHHLTDGFAAVDRPVVPDHHHRAAQVPQQVAERLADLRVLDVLRMQAKVEAQTPPARADRDARDRRDPLAALAVMEKWRATARDPGPLHTRDQEEAGVVDEDEVGAQPRAVFVMPGHVFFFQRSIRSSSRSSARRSGF